MVFVARIEITDESVVPAIWLSTKQMLRSKNKERSICFPEFLVRIKGHKDQTE